MSTPAMSNPIVGSGEHTYEVIHDWGRLPDHIRYGNCHGVVEDSQGLIYIHHTVHETSTSSDAVVVFDADGNFVRSWGAAFKGGAHGFHLEVEDGQEFLYFCDIDRRIVVKTTMDGEQVLRLSYPFESPGYEPGPDGEKLDYRPTNLAVGANGDIYVGDGYGSSYIIQYDKQGNYIRTFGGPGSDAGQVQCPHGIIHDTRGPEPVILVADRANNRLQEFSLDGEHRRFYSGVDLPCHFDIRGKRGGHSRPGRARDAARRRQQRHRPFGEKGPTITGNAASSRVSTFRPGSSSARTGPALTMTAIFPSSNGSKSAASLSCEN